MIMVALIGAALILIFQHGLYSNPTSSSDPKPQNIAQTNQVEVVSTSPTPLDQAVIWAQQPIQISFNTPLENVPEFKLTIDPKYDYKVELSDDKKTAIITPTQPLKLGVVYSIHISGDTKFEGKKTLGKDLIYNVRTIEYKGV